MDTEIVKRGPGRPRNDAPADAGRDEGHRPQVVTRATRYDAAEELRRAEEYAREIRENQVGLNFDPGADFDIPLAWIPPGWTYEWKRMEIVGQPDHGNMNASYASGWRPVPASRHPELCPVGFDGDSIVKKGLMLMERPAVITHEARLRDSAEARRAMTDKEKQLGLGPSGTFQGSPDGRLDPQIDKVFRPAEIPTA